MITSKRYSSNEIIETQKRELLPPAKTNYTGYKFDKGKKLVFRSSSIEHIRRF